MSTAVGAMTLRPAQSADAAVCGRIFYEAFASIANRHGFPVEPASPEFTAWRVGWMLNHPGFIGVIAERDGQVVGCAFADERDPVTGIGPVTVDPAAQDAGIGRALMTHLMKRAHVRRVASVRLVQTAYHYRSLALYARLGFVVREPLSVLAGPPPEVRVPGRVVRAATHEDEPACATVCTRVHGFPRSGELRDAVTEGTALVVERNRQISGYATGLGYGWHAVAEHDEDLQALLGCGHPWRGLGVLVPSRNAMLLTWCLEHDLRIVQQSTLMTSGAYRKPAGSYVPSILY